MIKFMRRNAIAFIALFIALGGTAYAANTVRSADIVDGTIKTVDLANTAVTPPKASGMWTQHMTLIYHSSTCAQSARAWFACAPLSVTVPAGKRYLVTVTSDIGAHSSTTGTLYYCPAKTGPTCIDDPEAFTLIAGQYMSVSSTMSEIVGPGNYTFSTAVNFPSALATRDYGSTTTNLTVTDYANNSPH